MSLINTRLLESRPDANIDKYEIKGTRNGSLALAQSQTADTMGVINPELQSQVVGAIGRAVKIPVIDYEATTIANTSQPLVVVGDPSTSQLVTISFTDYYFGFRIFPAAHQNNEISMQREFNQQMRRYEEKLLVDLNGLCLTAFEAKKTKILADTLGGRYTLTSNVITAALAEQDAVMGDVNPIMHGNNFYGPFDVIANPSMESLIRNRLMEKGQFSTEDKTYQWNDKQFFFDNALANATDMKATAIIVQKGSVGLLEQFAPDCLLSHSTGDGHEWDVVTLPTSGIRMGSYTYDGAINGATINGDASAHLTATLVQSYGFHKRVAVITPYNSDDTTYPSAIAKFQVETT
jgi:hypothetical protein